MPKWKYHILLARVPRFLRPAAEQVPEKLVEFTEMLPTPGECWLAGDAGSYTSELRLVAVDLQRRRTVRPGPGPE